MITYTTIQHSFRKENNLTCNEYVLCDMINMYANNLSSAFPGWCYRTREGLACDLDVSKMGVMNMIKRLIESDFLQQNEQTKYLKTTEKWNSVYFYTDGKQSLPKPVNKVYFSGKQSLPYNNKDNNKENNEVVQTVEKSEKKTKTAAKTVKERKDIFYQKLTDYQTTQVKKLPAALYLQFFSYWTETDKNGKMRFEDQKFFEIGKRLATFWRNVSDIKKQQMIERQNEIDREKNVQQHTSTNVNSIQSQLL